MYIFDEEIGIKKNTDQYNPSYQELYILIYDQFSLLTVLKTDNIFLNITLQKHVLVSLNPKNVADKILNFIFKFTE